METLKAKYVRLCLCLSAVVLSVMGFAFAGESSVTVDTIRTMTVTQLTTVQQALLNLISDIVPVALVVMGSVLVVSFGIRFFRRFAG